MFHFLTFVHFVYRQTDRFGFIHNTFTRLEAQGLGGLFKNTKNSNKQIQCFLSDRLRKLMEGASFLLLGKESYWQDLAGTLPMMAEI